MTGKRKHRPVCPDCGVKIEFLRRELNYEQVTNVEPNKKNELVGVVTHEQICSDNYYCPECDKLILPEQCGMTEKVYAFFGLQDQPYNPIRERFGKPIMDQITNFCENECSSKNECSEDECVLWRIQQIVWKDGE